MRRLAIVLGAVHLGTILQKQLDQREIAEDRGSVERSPTALLPRVHVSPMSKKHCDDSGGPTRSRAVERLDRHRIACDRVRVRPAIEEDPGHRLGAEERREVERRESVARPGSGQAGIGREQLRHHVPPPRAMPRPRRCPGAVRCPEACSSMSVLRW